MTRIMIGMLAACISLTVSAQLREGQEPGDIYRTSTRNTAITATLHGRAVRDAAILATAGALPLVIISHGYPGNRYLMSHLGENLASKGYVVASIDHRDSTYHDQQAFASTLYDRPLDQLFVLDQMATLSDTGGGYSDKLAAHETAPPNGLARRHAAAGFEDGTRAIYENATNSDRYLLTYVNAGHSAGAPIPLPVEVLDSEGQTGAWHYTDPVWDSVRMNNIMDHFATAFFDYRLKGDTERLTYLELIPDAQDGVFAVEEEQPTDAHTYWKGFDQGTARGLLLEHLGPAE